MSRKFAFLIALLTMVTIVFGKRKDDKNGQWSDWSPCSKTCGRGTKQRHFMCKKKNCKQRNDTKKVACMLKLCGSNVTNSSQVMCPPDFNKVQWPKTTIGETSVVPCPDGTNGNAMRYCGIDENYTINNTKAIWKEVDTSECVLNPNKYIQTQVNEIRACMKTFSKTCRNKTKLLLDDIYKQSSKQKSSKDLVEDVSALDAIIAFSKQTDNSKGFVNEGNNSENFINTASNLLEPRNSLSWSQLRKEKRRSHTVETLVRILDSIGFLIASTLTSKNNSYIIQTKNLALEAKKINLGIEFPIDGVNFTYERSSISLPASIFSQNESSFVVNIIYLTLGDILQLPVDAGNIKTRTGKDNVNTSTIMVSSTVKPKKKIDNKSYVKIVMQNKRTLPKLNTSSAICVSWNPEGRLRAWSENGCHLVPDESDADKTTCTCRHLTLFAAFMDPYQIPLSKTNRYVLDFISCIGCAVSLFSMAVTMSVILSNWKKLKSPRIEVVLNICTSIGIVCFLVLVEQPARHNKVLCKIMAVLLHYFLLTSFAWMFCEGILLYIVLVRVDVIGFTQNGKKPLYVLGWGFPLLLLAISLWATELNGYGNAPYVCWLSVKNGVVWAFVAPALVVIVANLFVLQKIICRLQSSKRIQNCSVVEQVKSGTRAAAATMPLLGITWLFGMLTFHTTLIVFKYLFTIFNSLQGVCIFIFHCLLDRQVRKIFKSTRSKRRTRPRPHPPIQLKPYEAYVIKSVQEPNR